jgi:SAM-dependent methyltransferase
MEEALKLETEKLVRSWMQYDAEFLSDYLVASVEDPRINVQSILTRHFLVAELVGNRYEKLMLQELRFAATLNWFLKRPTTAEERHAILHALQRGADNAEGDPIPEFVGQTFAALPDHDDEVSIPNYLEELLADETDLAAGPSRRQRILDLFAALWQAVLAKESRTCLSVLEPACGSANDYRFLEACGLTRLMDYSGFDLCEKNVANAHALFPHARFDIGNVFEIAADEEVFDLCFVHDLLEHLSPAGLERTIAELSRVTRRGLCVHFFQMDEIPEHIVRVVGDYHINTLSLERTEALFGRHGFRVQPLHIGSYLRQRVACRETHNPNAYTFLAFRP